MDPLEILISIVVFYLIFKRVKPYVEQFFGVSKSEQQTEGKFNEQSKQ